LASLAGKVLKKIQYFENAAIRGRYGSLFFHISSIALLVGALVYGFCALNSDPLNFCKKKIKMAEIIE
jgi:hypothetical protein